MNLPYCQGQQKLHMWPLALKGTCLCLNSGPRLVQLRQLPLINLCLQLDSWAHLKHLCNQNTSQRGGSTSLPPCSGSIGLGPVCRCSILPYSLCQLWLTGEPVQLIKPAEKCSFFCWMSFVSLQKLYFKLWISFSLGTQWKPELAEVRRCPMCLGTAEGAGKQRE